MADVKMLVENLEDAYSASNQTREDLKDAIKNADAVQALFLFDLIVEATELRNKIDRLLNAVKSED